MWIKNVLMYTYNIQMKKKISVLSVFEQCELFINMWPRMARELGLTKCERGWLILYILYSLSGILSL